MPGTAFRGLLFVALILAVAVSDAGARQHTYVPAAGPSASSAPSAAFDCGTYRDNWQAVYRDHYLHLALDHEVSAGRIAPSAQSANYVYDDVWVIEDDGTLLLSGNNTFDIPTTTLRFSPNASGGYDAQLIPFSISTAIGNDLGLGDDTESVQPLPFSFEFFGISYDSVAVGSNGLLGFGGSAVPSGLFSPNDFFGPVPKFAAYMLDLNPGFAQSVGVFFFAAPDSCVITYSGIYEYNSSRKNSFQIILRSDGTMDVAYAAIQSTGAGTTTPITVGISPGTGAPLLDRINYSADLPYSSAYLTGIYEDFLSLTAPSVIETALGKKFYQNFADVFFQYVFFSNFTQTMAGFANEFNIANSVTGIGLPIFDNSALFGSNGILESRCNMNSVTVWQDDPAARFFGGAQQSFLTVMGQESGHRWGAFVRYMTPGGQVSNLILGRSDAHWSYYLDIEHSSLEGGQWNEVTTNSYVCPSYVDFFSDVDEYLMGLRTPEEVSPMFYVSSSTNNLTSNRSAAPPVPNATAFGTPVQVTIDDIIAAEGPRTPLVTDEDKDLRQAFIFLLQGGTTASQAHLDRLANFRRAWEDYFEVSCDGRLTCNTKLSTEYQAAAVGGIVRDRLTDQAIANLTVHSVERGFKQAVPGGGRYAFRYLEDENTGPGESVLLVFVAPGYYTDSLSVSIAYGYEMNMDVQLDPVTSGVLPSRPLPTRLYQNFPNPFNPSTTISFDLASKRRVTLRVYDVRGRRVRTLIDGVEPAGYNRVDWDGRDDNGTPLTSGFYLYKLEAGDMVDVRKMVLVK